MNTLLQDIEQAIQQSGGRVKLAYLMMKETPKWFSHEEKMDINNRLSKQLSKEKSKRGKTPHKLYWSQDDLNYLIEHWGHKRSAYIAGMLGRTVAGCRQKVLSHLGEEKYKQRVLNGRYKTILNNKWKLKQAS